MNRRGIEIETLTIIFVKSYRYPMLLRGLRASDFRQHFGGANFYRFAFDCDLSNTPPRRLVPKLLADK